MHAAVITSPRQVELREFAVPEPAPGEVRVRVAGVGICGSNLPVWEGRPWFSYPLPPGAPGHEPWGRVDRVGRGVSEFAEGDDVAFLCDRAFAEYAIAAAPHVVRVPPSLADRPFPGEPLACAVNVARRCAFRRGEEVAIVGVGFLGAILVALASAAGTHVTAISRRDSALAVARAFGAHDTCRFDEVPDGLMRRGVTCAVEAVGSQTALDRASGLVRTRGRLVIAGYHQDGPRQVDMQSWNWRGLDVINAHERDEAMYTRGLREAIELVAAGVIDPSVLYTHSYRLDSLDAAFETARQRPAGFMKALVMP